MKKSMTNLTQAQATLLAKLQRPGAYADWAGGSIRVRDSFGGTDGKVVRRSTMEALVSSGLISVEIYHEPSCATRYTFSEDSPCITSSAC